MRKRLLFGAILLFFFISILLYIFSLGVEKDRYKELSSKISTYFHKLLDAQTSQALMIAITLSQNSDLKEALKQIDEDRGYELLSSSLEYLKRYTRVDMRAQIIAKDLTIFARSWDKEFAGMPIEGFRKDLSNFKIAHPKAGVETGRLLTIKATAPIKDRYKIIGYLEVIAFFEPLAKKLRDEGMELFVLMDERYLNVATLMRENPTIGSYVVSNTNYNAQILSQMRKFDLKTLLHNGFLKEGRYFYVSIPMENVQGERIGYYLIAMHEKRMKELMKLQENISFFLQFDRGSFYDLINLWRRPEANFNSVYDRNILEFLSKTTDEEFKQSLEIEAREILREYDKEQLIDIILDKYRHEKKRGVIK